MPPEMQVKLLRVLETFRVTRVGGTSELAVDVRIIAATNRDPHEAVKAGALRQDLLYRLFVFPIRLPALRERRVDVPRLAELFLQAVAPETPDDEPRAFTPVALQRLAAHDWPGNVRELRNVVRRAAIMVKGPLLDAHDLPLHGAAAPAASGTGEGPHLRPGMTVAQAERLLIEATLAHAANDKRRAAEMLGISLKTLYTRLKVYDASRSATPAEAREANASLRS
jgi:DNA-binding NtrC family response regulator